MEFFRLMDANSKIHDPFLAIGQCLMSPQAKALYGWKRITISFFNKSWSLASNNYSQTPWTESEYAAFKSLPEATIQVSYLSEGKSAVVRLRVLHCGRTSLGLYDLPNLHNYCALGKKYTAPELLQGFSSKIVNVQADGTKAYADDLRRSIRYSLCQLLSGEMVVIGPDYVDANRWFHKIGEEVITYDKKEYKHQLFVPAKYLDAIVDEVRDETDSDNSSDSAAGYMADLVTRCHHFVFPNGVKTPVILSQSAVAFDGVRFNFIDYQKALQMCAVAELNDERSSLFENYKENGYLNIGIEKSTYKDEYVLDSKSQALFESLCKFSDTFANAFQFSVQGDRVYSVVGATDNLILRTPEGKYLHITNAASYAPVCCALSMAALLTSPDGYLPSISGHLSNLCHLIEDGVLTVNESGVIIGTGDFQKKKIFLDDGPHVVTRRSVTMSNAREGALYLYKYESAKDISHYVVVVPHDGKLFVVYNPYQLSSKNAIGRYVNDMTGQLFAFEEVKNG